MSYRNIKALVLSGGKGTRLRPFTNTTTKQLLPVANRPILFYIMDMVKEAGIADIGLIVSSEWGDHVKQAIGDGSAWNAQVTYIPQREPAGLAHAVKVARQFLGNSPFLMILGDNVYKCNIQYFVAQFYEYNPDALLLLKEVDDPSNFGIAELGRGGEVTKVEEKPKEPRSNLALAGVYLFSPAIHEAINAVKPSQRGELEITDAIQQLIEMSRKVHGYILEGWWLDTGDVDDLLAANRKVLDEFVRPNIQGQLNSKTKITGKVEVGKGTKIENSKIHGPVSIAENCFIKNSLIGPFTSIGARTKVEDSSIEGSIIMGNCHIHNIECLVDSLIGSEVKLFHDEHKPKALRLFIGDDGKIEF